MPTWQVGVNSFQIFKCFPKWCGISLSSCKMINICLLTIVNTAVWFISKLLREEILKALMTRGNKKTPFFFFPLQPFFLIGEDGWMLTKFTVSIVSQYYVSQASMLYTLNWHSAVWRLYLNKTKENISLVYASTSRSILSSNAIFPPQPPYYVPSHYEATCIWNWHSKTFQEKAARHVLVFECLTTLHPSSGNNRKGE